MDIYEFLEKHEIGYQKVEHPPVFTCEQARELVPDPGAAELKNLFVKDKKGRNHLLQVETRFDLRQTLLSQYFMGILYFGNADYPDDGRKHPAMIWITGGDNNTIGDVWSSQSQNNDQSVSAFRKAGIIMMFPSQRGGHDNPESVAGSAVNLG